jgi:acyl-CoA reductase-like NAD-dependent aldehyde dehydrogenase|mmetsp:Transcript_93833/g.148216  ORF Transcript_93833/g.148216 Transcript_93833/m.148216 type:complete len:483 (-) Transcript_93833:215-1663(-)
MAIRTYDTHYINGAWVASSNVGKYLDVTDSTTAKVCARVPDGTAQEMEQAIKAARSAFTSWMNTPLAERKALMTKVLENWQKKKPECVEWLQKELGCTKTFATTVQSVLVDMHLGVALQQVDSIAFEEKTAMGALVVKEPIGVVGCITPWNYPLNQIAAKIFPAMLVGCTVVLKPSEVTPINAYLLAEAIHEAGVPPGVFNMVLGTGPVVGEVLSEHPDVDMISFTGSTRAGIAITQKAAGTLKVVRTELGGKSAALMLDDADLPKVMPEFIGQLMSNTGQSCNALSRMLVPKERYEEAVQIAKQVAEASTPGRSNDPKAAMGPLVSQTQWDRVQGYLKKGIEEGARLVTGGPGKPDGLDDGYYVKPTVFADVNNRMQIAQEEIFGPVLSIIPYSSEQEGIDIANDTVYGLNNAVGSSDPERALRVARQLRSGTVMINATGGKPDAPFGGYKQSGNAREWGKYGIEEYLVTKHLSGKPLSKL